MVKARSNAMVATVLMCLLMLHCELAQAGTYVVGGRSGWTYGVQTWPENKKFKAKDILVFYYSPFEHNVVAATEKEYLNCKTSNHSKIYQTGKDRIVLKTGPNYFFCSYKGQCGAGMKMAVHAY